MHAWRQPTSHQYAVLPKVLFRHSSATLVSAGSQHSQGNGPWKLATGGCLQNHGQGGGLVRRPLLGGAMQGQSFAAGVSRAKPASGLPALRPPPS